MRPGAALLAAVLLGSAVAEEPATGPLIEGHGPTFAVEDRDVPLPEDFFFRVVFDLAEDRAAGQAANPGLVSAARFLNMHARNGVPAERMDLVVVVHGSAIDGILSNEAYRRRHGRSNPNSDLLAALADAGVRLQVCGQSLAFRGYVKTELAEPVAVALSAMTQLTILQGQGYSLLPW